MTFGVRVMRKKGLRWNLMEYLESRAHLVVLGVFEQLSNVLTGQDTGLGISQSPNNGG